MATPRAEPPTDDVGLLLRYAELTYQVVAGQRRRQAWTRLLVALVLGALAVVAGLRWADAREQARGVEDEALVEALGVSIPDPRPAIQRAELRVRAFFYGWAAVSCGSLALLSVAAWAAVRPPPAPPQLPDRPG